MPEIRQNIVTREWVIIATERAKRPEEFVKKVSSQVEMPAFKDSCPFCPGNESKTPPEHFTISKQGSDKWQVRVIPNKFAALSSKGEKERSIEGIKRSLTGVGIHDVIIETPVHNLTTALLSKEEIKIIIEAYKRRYLEVSIDPRVEQVIIFKNHGEAAGTSLEHPHSQLIGTPVMPIQVRHRVEEMMRFFDDMGVCSCCYMVEQELKYGERVIIDSPHFLVFTPYAALSPFHTWILPKKHSASFGNIKAEEIDDLADVLKKILGKLYYGLNNPDYNYVIRSMKSDGGNLYVHWYLTIVPRLSKAAGFELGSGMFINTSLPEENAKFLRDVEVK